MTRFNFGGRHLKIAANPIPPILIGETRNDQFHPTAGSDYEFLLFLAHYFNFTWTILDQHGEWGTQTQKNGSFSGLIGAIASGQCDFALGVSLRLESDGRGEHIDFTIEYLSGRVTFVTLKNEPVPLHGVLMMPFSTNCWILVLLTVGVLMACGRGFATLYNGSYGSKTDLEWIVFGSLLQKAPRYDKQTFAAIHIIIQLSWMTGLILLSAYGGAIISSLTANAKVKNLDSVREFDELTLGGQITPVMIRTASYMYDFVNYRDKVQTYDLILRNMITVNSIPEALLMLAGEKLDSPRKRHAMICSYPYAKIWCDTLGPGYFHILNTMESSLFTDNYALAFPEKSPLIPHFNLCIQMAIEHGFFRKWYSQQYRWNMTGQSEIVDMLDSTVSQHFTFESKIIKHKKLELENLQEHFYLLLGGLAVATVSFFLEVGLLYLITHCRYCCCLRENKQQHLNNPETSFRNNHNMKPLLRIDITTNIVL